MNGDKNALESIWHNYIIANNYDVTIMSVVYMYCTTVARGT